MSYALGSTLVVLGLMALGIPAAVKICRDLDRSNENDRVLEERRSRGRK